MYKNITGLKGSCFNSKSVFWIGVLSLSYLFFYLFSDICFPFIVGFALAYLCAPLINFLTRYVNRTLLSLIFALCSVFVFILAGIEILPRIKEYLVLLANNAPAYYDRFISFLDSTFSSVDIARHESEITSLKLEMQKYLDQKIYILASIIGRIASQRGAITSFLSFFIIMPISFFYFLRDWNILTCVIHDSVPNRQKNTLMEAFAIVRKTFTNFFHGQFYVVAVLSAYYALLLFSIGVESYICLGVMSGLFSFIPFIGALFSCFLVIFICVPTMTLTKVYIIFAIYLVGQFFEGYVLSPKFVGKKTGLHPLWILFSFFAGIQLQGVIGVLIAIPLAAVARNLVGFTMDKLKATQAYKQ